MSSYFLLLSKPSSVIGDNIGKMICDVVVGSFSVNGNPSDAMLNLL